LPYEAVDSTHSYWMFGIVINEALFGMNKNALRSYLAAHGIETRSFFIPIHVQPPYYDRYGTQSCPIAEQLCRDGLYLPSSTKLTKKDIEYIAKIIRNAHQSKKLT